MNSGKARASHQAAAVAIGQVNTLLLPPNPNRIGLILSGNGQQMWVAFEGRDPTVEANVGIVVGPSRAADFLTEEFFGGALQGEIRCACAIAGTGSVYATEIVRGA